MGVLFRQSILNFANPGKGSLNYYSQPLPIRHLMVSFQEKEIVREYIKSCESNFRD